MTLRKRKSGLPSLKGKLSEYLRAVRKGSEVVIKDRETPIARLVPFEKSRLGSKPSAADVAQ